MAYSTFPSYAQFLLDDYELQVSGGVERSEMEDGVTQQAPAQSLGTYTQPVRYRLASAQRKADFEQWRRVTLANGALHFDWPDPADGITKRARIVGGKVTYRLLAKHFEEWSAAFSIEYYA